MDSTLVEEIPKDPISQLFLHDSIKNTIDWQQYVTKTPSLIYKRRASLHSYFKKLVVTINSSPLDTILKSVCIKYLKVLPNTKLTKTGLDIEALSDLSIKGAKLTNRQKYMIVHRVEDITQSMLKWTNFQRIVDQIPQLKYPQGFRKFLHTIRLPLDTPFNNLSAVLKIYLVKVYDARAVTFFKDTTALEIERIISANKTILNITEDSANDDNTKSILINHQENIGQITSNYGRDLILTILLIKEEVLKLAGYNRYFFIKLVWEELESCLEEHRVFDKTVLQFKPNSTVMNLKKRLPFHNSLESIASEDLKQLRRAT